jgi:hypothetical protein
MKEQIRDLLHASPFLSFVIHTADGKSFRVDHPDFVLAGSDAPHVYVEEPSGRVHRINVMLIKSLEEVPMSSEKSS